ncbi:WD repeat-containing protein 86 [Halocaridina rubra]|uniref:WD repeat-containing protein 86 n=1 Tax=Halocaridina rubra TaxID=373956 RepID=A0AAN8WN02_HALRR
MGNGSSKKTLLRETLCDHEKPINCMAVSEDGSIVVTGSDDKTARLWTAGSQETECLGVLKGHTQYVTCIALTDEYVLTGSADCTIRKWDPTSCDCVAVYEGHEARIIRILCTGEYIFSASNDQTAKTWVFDVPEYDEEDSETVSCIKTFEGHSLGISAMIFIPGEGNDIVQDEDERYIDAGDILITGSTDSTARSWSFATGKTIKIFRGHKSAISCMSSDPEGTVLYTGSMDHSIRCWNIHKGECMKVLEGHAGPVLTLHVVNKLIYSGSSDNTAKCWVRNFDFCGNTYKGHLHTVTHVKYHEGYLFTASGDACARAFDAKSGTLKAVFRAHTSAVTCLCLLDNFLYTGSSDGTLRVWDASRSTLESEELQFELEEENDDEVQPNPELDKFEKKLERYEDDKDDVDLSSNHLKPPSTPGQERPSRLLAPSPTPSGRSRLSPSPSRLHLGRGPGNNNDVPYFPEELDL